MHIALTPTRGGTALVLARISLGAVLIAATRSSLAIYPILSVLALLPMIASCSCPDHLVFCSRVPAVPSRIPGRFSCISCENFTLPPCSLEGGPLRVRLRLGPPPLLWWHPPRGSRVMFLPFSGHCRPITPSYSGSPLCQWSVVPQGRGGGLPSQIFNSRPSSLREVVPPMVVSPVATTSLRGPSPYRVIVPVRYDHESARPPTLQDLSVLRPLLPLPVLCFRVPPSHVACFSSPMGHLPASPVHPSSPHSH